MTQNIFFKQESILENFTYDSELVITVSESDDQITPKLGDIQFRGVRTTNNVVQIMGVSADEEHASQRYLKFKSVSVVPPFS